MMSQPGDSNGWLPWILGGAGIATFIAIVWKALSQIFSYVTRDELAKLIAAQDEKYLAALATQAATFESALEQHRAERIRIADEQRRETLRLHDANGEVNTAIRAQLQDQGNAIARIEGKLSGPYPALNREG